MMSSGGQNRYNGREQAAAQGSPAQASGSGSTNAKIYVANMPQDFNEQKLTEIFGRYGDICAVNHKGSYAFIEYAESHMADDAISETRASGSSLKVQLAFSKNNSGSGGGYGGVYGGGYGGGNSNSYSGGGGNEFGAPSAAKKFGGGGGGGGGQNNCFKCGEDGHWASSCPMNGGVGRG